MRLIDADALMGVVTKNSYILRSEHNTTDYGMFLSGIKQAVDEAPAIDAAPVVHGRWRKDTDPADGDLRCTHCGAAWPKCVQKQIEEQGIWTLQTLFKYCPNCGANMDGKDDNE